MKFFQKNSWAILLLIGAFLSEYLHTWIDGVHSTYINEFGENVTVSLSDAIYYFVHSMFSLFLIIAIFVHIDNEKLASKVIMSGIIFWFLVEFYEAYNYLEGNNNDMVEGGIWSFWQKFIGVLMISLAYYGFRRYRQ